MTASGIDAALRDLSHAIYRVQRAREVYELLGSAAEADKEVAQAMHHLIDVIDAIRGELTARAIERAVGDGAT